MRFHEPSRSKSAKAGTSAAAAAAAAAADGGGYTNEGLNVKRRNNIYALHTGIRGGKEKRALTSSIIIRDIALNRFGRGNTVSVDSAAVNDAAADEVDVPSPPETMEDQQKYAYPVMTNGELKRVMDKFRLNRHAEISGDMLVCLVGERLSMDMGNYAYDDRQCGSYVNALIDSFPSLKAIRPSRSADYMHLITFFIGWICTLQGISNVTASIATGELNTSVPGLNNTKLLCEASKPVTRNKRKHGSDDPSGGGGAGGVQDDDEDDADEDEIDHVAMLEMMTAGIDVSMQYGSSKAVLSPEYIMVLHEILNYKNYNISVDQALSSVNAKIDKSKFRIFNVCICLNNINTLLQAFDVYDMPMVAEFERAVNATAAVRNIVFPLKNTKVHMSQRDNVANVQRFTCFRQMRNMPYGNLEMSELSNLYITPYRKFDTIDNIIRAHALTPHLCLKLLENLMSLSQPQLWDKVNNKLVIPYYYDSYVFDMAAQSVAQGTYLTDRRVHQIATISVAKRYTCLALLETYIELNFAEKLNRFFYVRNESYMWYIYHALFFRRIDLYRYLIERAFVLGRSLEISMTTGTMPNEVALQAIRNIITLPLLLIFDCYDQIYRCGDPGTLCTFRMCSAIDYHKHPRLYNPTAQCFLYHNALVDMQIPIGVADSYQSLTVKYLRTVVFGRDAASKDMNDPKYTNLGRRLAQWYHFINCRMLDLDESMSAHEKRTELERREMLKYMQNHPVISPRNRIMRAAMPGGGQSVLNDIEGFTTTPLRDPFGGALDNIDRRRRVNSAALSAAAAAAAASESANKASRKRRFNLTSATPTKESRIQIENILKSAHPAPQAQSQ